MAQRLNVMRDTGTLASAAGALGAGRLVVYPTETFYGLGAALTEAALERLIAAKGREPGKPVPIIAASREAALARFTVPEALQPLLALWPAALTLALVPKQPLPQALLAADGTVGVRVSPLPLAREVALVAGGCITSTSANRAGQPPAQDPGAVDPELLAAVDILLDSGPTPGGAPSTIVAARGGRAVVVRAGAVPAEALAASLGYVPELAR